MTLTLLAHVAAALARPAHLVRLVDEELEPLGPSTGETILTVGVVVLVVLGLALLASHLVRRRRVGSSGS